MELLVLMFIVLIGVLFLKDAPADTSDADSLNTTIDDVDSDYH